MTDLLDRYFRIGAAAVLRNRAVLARARRAHARADEYDALADELEAEARETNAELASQSTLSGAVRGAANHQLVNASLDAEGAR